MKQKSKNDLKTGEIEKNQLRKKILKLRNSISKKEWGKRSERIYKNILKLDEFLKAKTVMLFASFGSEPDTKKIIIESLKMKKRVVLPKVDTKKNILKPMEIKNYYRDLKPGFHNILEPVEKAKVINEKDIDIVIVPGVVFDSKGNRIGYGKGYYDNFLKKIPLKKRIGLSFECQIVKRLPHRKKDLAVSKLITEKGVRICRPY
ncbi:MAG: 5-formyltetrahydrofolate cyclo-ligase [Endomicrobiia bacterium]